MTPMLLERLTHFTLLGIRFWDAALDRPVADGLTVTAWPTAAPRQVRRAVRTASGVYAFHGLPGMRRLEQATAADILAASPPDITSFVVAVADAQRRFFPVAFEVSLPLPDLGVFPTAVSTSPPGSPGFYLFSAPTRAPAPGLAVVRAQLVEAGSQQPAAYAVVEAEVRGHTHYAIADARGALALLFPYPLFVSALGASPPGGLPLAEQQWPLTLRVRYQPAAQAPLPGTPLPALASLFAQPAATIWPSTAGTAVSQLTFDLLFGQELVLRTGAESTLWITPPP